MRNANKGYAIPVIIVLFALLAAGIGLYLVTKSTVDTENKNQLSDSAPDSNIAPDQTTASEAASNTSSGSICDISLEVRGGTFSPGQCEFQIITSGVPCGSAGCSPQYDLVMKDTAAGHIAEVRLIGIRDYKKGTYTFDKASGVQDFAGKLIDQNSINRNLVKGEVNLNPSGDNTVQVSFDLSFANNVTVKGLGNLKVVSAEAS
ncbi:MAG: hypothetical protein Q7S15_01855 [bacterium]|nr:hypothetical protein [bacterium]